MTALTDTPLALPGHGVAARYAERLLAELGFDPAVQEAPSPRSSARIWAESGAMALSGLPDALPRVPPGAVTCCANGVGLALRALGAVAPGSPASLLGERAALAGLHRQGRLSVGGSARLLRASDGWVALNLARPEDVAALPAWLEAPPVRPLPGDATPSPELEAAAWAFACGVVSQRSRRELAERAHWLGLPFAVAGDRTCPTRWCERTALAAPVDPIGRAPLVLDFTALWAGPLAGSLLVDAGARVVKVETTGRPDGARHGNEAFHHLLNAGKESVAIDPESSRDEALLRALLDRADIVLESTRPRALRQWGIEAERFVGAGRGRVWVSITGYGREDPAPGRVAFGDEAGVAAGLANAIADAEGPLFCGDAIADPLTGLHAALAAWAAWRRGGGELCDVSLAGVVHHTLHFAPMGGFELTGTPAAPRLRVGREEGAVSPPRARTGRGRAAAVGADNASVRRSLGLAC